MGTVTYEALIKGVLKFGEKQRELERFCPFACRNERLVCVGRASNPRRIQVVNSWGIESDVTPDVVRALADCPVVRHPNSLTIELG